MKRLLFVLCALFITLSAIAQSENSIIIDSKSFRPVNTDVLTGVNIDPIGVDSSRRPCARIKMRVNRMTKSDINAIEVRIITNNELRKHRTAEYDNGLIIEMTAKPETRFYLYHPRLGYSNEVMVNLEQNKEYRIDAYLNQQLSISIQADIARADVYLDDVFRGQTGSDNSFVIHDVTPGDHKLRISYANKRAEQSITVSSNKLSFPVEVLTAQDIDSQSKPSANRYNYEVRVQKVSTHADRRKSFEQSVVLGAQTWMRIGHLWNYYSYDLNYILGYRTSKNIFCGAGAGVTFSQNNVIGHGEYGTIFTSKVALLLFANMRVYISKSDWMPFFSLSVGGRLSRKQQYQDIIRRTSGPLGEVMVGIDLRTSDKLSINLQTGCIVTTWADSVEAKPHPFGALSLKFGVTF